MYKKAITVFVIFFISVFILYSDFNFYSINKQYERAYSLLGLIEPNTMNYYSLSSKINENVLHHFSFYKKTRINSTNDLLIYYPELWISYNSFTPSGGNDGSAWQGKGFNGEISGGAGFYSKYFSITLLPLVWFSENKDYDLIETIYSSGYGDYWTSFDNLQRYGDKPYYDFSLGESDIRFKYGKFTVGISNESIIIGPGQFNNIILGNNAGGFPHIDLGTNGKIEVGDIGSFEFRYLWGLLRESEYYDNNEDNDYAFISGMYAAYAPTFIPNLSIGINHQYYKPFDKIDGFDIVRGIPFARKNNYTYDSKDVMISLAFSWLIPQVRFEFYGEWARNDNIPSMEDFLKAPEHTQGFTFGVNQILYESSNRSLMMTFEYTSLAQERTLEVRAAGPWYRHGWAGWTQGYTNNGQLLGAAIGPGSDSQTLKLFLFSSSEFWSISVQRIGHDRDYYYYVVKSDENKQPYTELDFKIERGIVYKNMQIFLAGTYAYLLNYNFEKPEESNIHIEIGFKYFW
jgi:hypothetical protein